MKNQIVLYVLAENGYPLGYRILPRDIDYSIVCKIADALLDHYPNGEHVYAVLNKPEYKQAWQDTRTKYQGGHTDWTEFVCFRGMLLSDQTCEMIA